MSEVTLHKCNNFSNFVQEAMQDLPENPDESSLQACAYDVRRTLIETAILGLHEDAEEKQLSTEHIEEYEDILRKTLPPLQTPAIRRAAKSSAWRSALLAVLGLLFGSAIGQGLSLVPSINFGSAAVAISGIIGVILTLWFSEFLIHSANIGRIKLPFGQYTWKKARKLFRITWFALLMLAIVRDFFSARIGLAHILESIGLFLSTGNVLGIFSNIYGLLGFIAAIAILIKRPKIFDKEDFAQKLEVAACNWWSGAELVAKLLMENNTLKNTNLHKRWQEVGRDIYSFSGELTEKQRQWLLERLRILGLDAPRETSALSWHKDMSEHYITLGHIVEGDACYVDEPPILENGLVVKKGIIRKVR